MSTIQSFTAEDRELKRVEDLSNEYRNANKKAIRLSVAFVPMIKDGNSMWLYSYASAWWMVYT